MNISEFRMLYPTVLKTVSHCMSILNWIIENTVTRHVRAMEENLIKYPSFDLLFTSGMKVWLYLLARWERSTNLLQLLNQECRHFVSFTPPSVFCTCSVSLINILLSSLLSYRNVKKVQPSQEINISWDIWYLFVLEGTLFDHRQLILFLRRFNQV